MGVVSFNIVYTNDFDKYTTNWYINYFGDKTMNKEAVVTHFAMFIIGCVTMYMMVNYL